MLITTGSSDLPECHSFPAAASQSTVIFLTIFFRRQEIFRSSSSTITVISFIITSPQIRPTERNLPFHYLPHYILASLRSTYCGVHPSLSDSNYKVFKGRDGELPILVFLGHQAKWLPYRGYLINSYIKFASANAQHHREVRNTLLTYQGIKR